MMTLNDFIKICHTSSKDHYWWPRGPEGEILLTPELIGTKFALIHSEVSEALEAYRCGARDEHLPHLPGVAVELANVLIRLFDLAGGLNLDLDEAFDAKLAYNKIRHDHSLEARAAQGGKKF